MVRPGPAVWQAFSVGLRRRSNPRPPHSTAVTAVLTAAVVLVIGWFAAGSLWNVRKGSATLRWFRDGLPLLGEKTTLRWLGTTSVDLSIARAKRPFESAALVIFLEPRDVPWIWGVSRWRGRRDLLIFRGQTHRPPVHDIEAVAPGSWSEREARRRIESEAWPPPEQAAAGDLTVFTRTADAVPLARMLLDLARDAGIRVRRLSVRRREPHLQLHVDLPGPPMAASRFFGALRAIGERTINE
jgi:hypothetical protein